jgi:hypothetical protein
MLLDSPARAAEGGLSNFPYGAQTTYAAFVPAPGTSAFYGYALYVNADSVRDGDGDKVPGVSVEVLAFAPRLLHTWNSTFFGWRMTSGGLTEGIYADVKVPGAEDDDLGPTLVGIEPLYLSKTFGAWTFFHGPLIYLPLGTYQPNKLANSNVNFKSFTYQGAVTWTPNARLEVSLNGAVEFKEENKKTNYEAGPQASLTFGTGYKPFTDQHWDFGFSGYYADGLADDKRNGKTVPGGGRTKKFAIGPKLVYWINPATAIVAQWHRDLVTENGARGDLFWLECAIPF